MTPECPDFKRINKILVQALETGDFSDALSTLRKHLKNHPYCVPTYRAMALCFSHRSGKQGTKKKRLDDQKKALDLYETILQRDPKNADAWYGIACVYNRKKEFARTVKAFKKAHKLWGGQKKYFMYLGHFYRDHGDFKNAAKYYTIAASYISDHYGPNFALATVYEEMGHAYFAKKYANRSLEIYKKMPRRYHQSIRVRADMKRIREIIKK